jgi:hypothetical protein
MKVDKALCGIEVFIICKESFPLIIGIIDINLLFTWRLQ